MPLKGNSGTFKHRPCFYSVSIGLEQSDIINLWLKKQYSALTQRCISVEILSLRLSDNNRSLSVAKTSNLSGDTLL